MSFLIEFLNCKEALWTRSMKDMNEFQQRWSFPLGLYSSYNSVNLLSPQSNSIHNHRCQKREQKIKKKRLHPSKNSRAYFLFAISLIQAVQRIPDIISKCQHFGVVPWKIILQYLQKCVLHSHLYRQITSKHLLILQILVPNTLSINQVRNIIQILSTLWTKVY